MGEYRISILNMNDNILNNKLGDEIYNFSRLMKENVFCEAGVTHFTLLQLKALVYIANNKEIRMKEIAEHFHVETPTATSLINKLSTMKLVRRIANARDRRVVKITLTKTGEVMLKKAKAANMSRINKTFSYLNNEEKVSLLKILKKLTAKLEEVYAK